MNGISPERYKELYGSKRKKNLDRSTESEEQQALFQWAKLQECAHPELALLHHVPNGGYRSPKTATVLKAEGVKAGVPDVCLPVARGGYFGLYIEMKIKGNKPSNAQLWWIDKLQKEGYLVWVCYGFEAAKEKILGYLEGERK